MSQLPSLGENGLCVGETYEKKEQVRVNRSLVNKSFTHV